LSRRMAAAQLGGRWVEARLAGLAGALGFGEGVVHFEDGFLGAVAAVGVEALTLHDRIAV